MAINLNVRAKIMRICVVFIWCILPVAIHAEKNDRAFKERSLLSSLTGNLLTDFPAIWCGSSRPENSYVIQAYNQYKDSATIKVKLSNSDNYPVFFPSRIGGEWFRDSVYMMENGYRVYRLAVSGTRLQQLFVRSPSTGIILSDGYIPGPQPTFLLKEGATIIIEGDAENPTLVNVTSSDKDVSDFEIYRSKDKVLEARLWSLAKEVYKNEKDTILRNQLGVEQESIRESREEWRKEFVKKYGDTYAALEVFNMYCNALEINEAIRQLNTLPEKYRNTPLGVSIKSRLDAVHSTSSGEKVIPFKQKGIDGKMVDIVTLTGKVVLIDFWGSWCGPCRASHPHLKEVYKKYKKNGFEIVGVAFEQGDQTRQVKAWKEAVKEDGINWLQVLNGPDKSDLVKLYGVTAFPTKVLVDRDGKIVLRYVGDEPEELDNKLKEIFSSSM